MWFQKHTQRTGHLDRVAKLYLAYKFFGALYFVYPIFYQFAAQVITPVQVGLFFSAIGVWGFLADIPTGIIADKRSRRLSGLLGMSLLTVAPLIIFIGHSFAAYAFSALFYGLGGAFLNGALDSLVYDHKNVTRETYRRVNTLEITFGQAGILVSAALGGLLFGVAPGLPFIVQAMAGVVCLAIIFSMQEEHKPEYVRPTSSHVGHFVESLKYLFATPYLRVLTLMGTVFSVMLGMCIQFVHEAAMIEHGLNGTLRGFLISGAGLATLVILNVFLLRVVKGDAARLVYLTGGAALAYVCLGVGPVPLFLVGYLVWCCLNATSVFVRVMVQDHIPSTHRATIMSSFKTLAVLIGLGASTGTGILVQWAHTPRAAYVLFAMLSGVVLVPCAAWLIARTRSA